MTMTGALVEQGVDDATTERPASTSGFQKHIQGLRAVAVGLVIANHLLGVAVRRLHRGGRLFVISGFLITGLLLREQERSNRISLREFYARRMRRIFPMAVVVLMCTVAVGFAVLTVKRADATLVDAIWAFFSLRTGTSRGRAPTTSTAPTPSHRCSGTGRCRSRSSSTWCGRCS